MLEFRSGGRRVSSDEFIENLKREAIDQGMTQLEQRIHDAAASIVNSETGKHAEVFVRRTGETQLTLQTSGSPAFARELERVVGLDTGSIETTSTAPADNVPRVYLAHASEDHATLAKPLAERLMANGINVWLDEWEIRAGDSLRRKMEEGLADCTHFVVILTPNSLHKPWVETEIDAGFVPAVGGKSRFIGLRAGIGVHELSPFLRTLRCPEVASIRPAKSTLSSRTFTASAASRNVAPGRATSSRCRKELKRWSPAAAAVAEHLVRTSKFGRKFDPQETTVSVAQTTGLPEEDVRMGVLDLADSGLVERRQSLSAEYFWPTDETLCRVRPAFPRFRQQTGCYRNRQLRGEPERRGHWHRRSREASWRLAASPDEQRAQLS